MPMKLSKKTLISIGLTVGTVTAYWAARSFGFADIDDSSYVVRNPHVAEGLSAANIVWAFTRFHISNWHPLTWMSLQIDASLWGLNPSGFHLTNIALHVLASVLLFMAFNRLTGHLWSSAALAFLFAVHPTRVESVVWITERKDVLSGVFWAASLWAYARYAEKESWTRYALLFLFFGLGLMSKPMVLTLPFVLLLLDFWPLQRLSLSFPLNWGALKKRTLEKAPLFALTLVMCVVTFVAQRAGQAVKTIDVLPLSLRAELALVAYMKYVGKFLFPRGLIIFYPIDDISGITLALASFFIGFATYGAVRSLRKYPYLGVGWFWYLGTLIPVIGLVQVGDQAMADRYSYIPSIGLSIAMVWGLGEIAGHFRLKRSVLIAPGVALALLLIALTRHQTSYWQTGERLWMHALKVVPGNHYALVHLTAGYMENGQVETAIAMAEKGLIELKYSSQRLTDRSYAAVVINLGMAYLIQKRFLEARNALAKGLETVPYLMSANFAYVNSLLALGRLDEAMAHMEKTFKEYTAEPLEPWTHLCQKMVQKGHAAEALRVFELLAESYARKERYQEAAKIIADARRLAQASEPSRTPAYDELLRRYLSPRSP